MDDPLWQKIFEDLFNYLNRRIAPEEPKIESLGDRWFVDAINEAIPLKKITNNFDINNDDTEQYIIDLGLRRFLSQEALGIIFHKISESGVWLASNVLSKFIICF